jgi:hypothetical protein
VTIDRDTTEGLAATGTPRGHEPDVVPSRTIWVSAIALIVILSLGYFVPTALEGWLLEREARRSTPANPLAATAGRRLPPAPRLQVNPARDMAELRLAEDRILLDYGWVDRQKGIARIPIDRAMAILAAKGRPRAPAPVAPPAPAPRVEGAP